jgi:RNA polymerase sigma factor (sigma-70 family)
MESPNEVLSRLSRAWSEFARPRRGARQAAGVWSPRAAWEELIPHRGVAPLERSLVADWEQLIGLLLPVLVRLAERRLQHASAEDVAANVARKLWSYGPGHVLEYLEGVESVTDRWTRLRAYLATASNHEVSNVRRDERRHAWVPLHEGIADPHDWLAYFILADDLGEALGRLDKDLRLIVLLRWEGETLETIAERLACSVSSVHRREAKALQAVRDFLGD